MNPVYIVNRTKLAIETIATEPVHTSMVHHSVCKANLKNDLDKIHPFANRTHEFVNGHFGDQFQHWTRMQVVAVMDAPDEESFDAALTLVASSLFFGVARVVYDLSAPDAVNVLSETNVKAGEFMNFLKETLMQVHQELNDVQAKQRNNR